MHGFGSLFLYFSRRAQQEQIAAINARSAEAAAAHQQLSGLHATEALLALADGDPADCSWRAVGRLEVGRQCC